MPCAPAPAISPTDSRTRPTTSSTTAAVPPPLRTATMMQATPTRVASHPTTNRPGAERPSMVKMEAPGRDVDGGAVADPAASGALTGGAGGTRTGAGFGRASGSDGEAP